MVWNPGKGNPLISRMAYHELVRPQIPHSVERDLERHMANKGRQMGNAVSATSMTSSRGAAGTETRAAIPAATSYETSMTARRHSSPQGSWITNRTEGARRSSHPETVCSEVIEQHSNQRGGNVPRRSVNSMTVDFFCGKHQQKSECSASKALTSKNRGQRPEDNVRLFFHLFKYIFKEKHSL